MVRYRINVQLLQVQYRGPTVPAISQADRNRLITRRRAAVRWAGA